MYIFQEYKFSVDHVFGTVQAVSKGCCRTQVPTGQNQGKNIEVNNTNKCNITDGDRSYEENESRSKGKSKQDVVFFMDIQTRPENR